MSVSSGLKTRSPEEQKTGPADEIRWRKMLAKTKHPNNIRHPIKPGGNPRRMNPLCGPNHVVA